MPHTQAPELPFWPIVWVLALAMLGASVSYSSIARAVKEGSNHDPGADQKPWSIAPQNQQPTARHDEPVPVARQQDDFATTTAVEQRTEADPRASALQCRGARRYDFFRVVFLIISLAAQLCLGICCFWCTRLLAGGCVAVLYWANEFTSLLPVIVVVVSTLGLLVCILGAFGVSMMFLIGFWVYQVRNYRLFIGAELPVVGA